MDTLTRFCLDAIFHCGPAEMVEVDRDIMECEWLGGRLPSPPPFLDPPWCDRCPDDYCDWCAQEHVRREWQREWDRAWDAVLERIDAGDDSWEDDFHFRVGARR
jgi:hypothetical protein